MTGKAQRDHPPVFLPLLVTDRGFEILSLQHPLAEYR
jgi:hypothetical protein